jgi:hypothetical protein
MIPTLSRYVISHELRRRRYRHQSLLLAPHNTFTTVLTEVGKMPASQTRNERRKKAREAIVDPTKFATVEDGEEEVATAVLAHSPRIIGTMFRSLFSNPVSDIIANPTIDARGVMQRLDLTEEIRQPAPSFPPTKQHQQKKSKSRVKHGRALGSSKDAVQLPEWVDAMQPLDTLTPAQVQLLQEKIMEKMKENGGVGLWPITEDEYQQLLDTAPEPTPAYLHRKEVWPQTATVTGPGSAIQSSAATVVNGGDETPVRKQSGKTLDLPLNVTTREPPSPGVSKPDGDLSSASTVLAKEAAGAKLNLSTQSCRTHAQRKGNHHRSSSTDLTNTGTKPSIAFGAHRLSNDGMLDLKAGASKESQPAANEQKHRRRISLNLPINVSRLDHVDTPPPTSNSITSKYEEKSVLEKQERELEYKHRHTFIGIASLDDFLDIITFTPTYTTSKCHIAGVFILLAAIEQMDARECSSVPDGWEFVTRTTHELAFGYEDYLNQAHIKLGSITLGRFLKMFPFDKDENVGAMSVVEAFCAASHLDAKANCGTRSRAKAFRSWMVRRKES